MTPRVPLVGIRLVREGTLPWPEGTGREIKRPGDAAEAIGPWIGSWDRECFVVLLLNTRHRVLMGHVVSVGGLDSAPIHPREVFRLALIGGAAGVILAHNHPSGEPEPSEEDRRITARLVEAGKVVGVEILDHVVIGAGKRYVSLRERGMLG